jgi:chromosome segregation ATPase
MVDEERQDVLTLLLEKVSVLDEIAADVRILKSDMSQVKAMLAEHSAILAEHSAILAEHSAILADHTIDLKEIKQYVGTHAEEIFELKAASHSH